MTEIFNIMFLDFDGVLNCELHYRSDEYKQYMEKGDKEDDMLYHTSQICKERISWLNSLCKDANIKVVISSTWRGGKTIEQLQELLNNCGATFEVIGKTGYCDCRIRGVEIKQWLDDNCMELFGVHSHDFYRYAIIDDDSDMLLNQQNHFFQTDTYSGLTPSTCYRIKRFFTHETF